MIFPELKYLERIKKIDRLTNSKSLNIDNILLLGILLIDGSNNHEYFCHKYKTSNETQERLINLNNDYQKSSRDVSFFKTDLKKNIFLSGKKRMKDLLKLKYFLNKNDKESDLFLKLNEIDNTKVPIFPINGAYLKENGFKEGKKNWSCSKYFTE